MIPPTLASGAVVEAPARVQRRIYLDHHATTPLDPRVLERMLPFFGESFGNPASQDHAWGWAAGEALDQSRDGVARFIGATADEIVFTSGATESNNLAIFGTAGGDPTRRHMVTSAIEHASVLGPVRQLGRQGYALTILPVDGDGLVDPDRVRAALRPDTALVTIQAANNEIGTVQPIAEVGALCRAAGVPFHVDASQAAAWLPLDVQVAAIDLLSLSAHKMYGPKGIGALFVRRRRPRLPLAAIQFGGGQEHGLRPGTANVPAIVGFAEACALVRQHRAGDAWRVAGLRDDLWQRIGEGLPGATLNGSETDRPPTNLHVTLPGHDAERLMRALPGIALSSGAACATDRRLPSHVLLALGRDPDAVHSSLRFGLGRSTTPDDIATVADRLLDVVGRQGYRS